MSLLRAPAWRVWMPALLTVLAVLVAAPPASAQYFGRNKVQYRTYDFRVLKTENFDVYYYPEEEAAARDAARMAERWYERLSRILDHRFEERQPLVFYGSHPAFQQTTTLGGSIGEGTGGVTESAQQRVIMPLTGSYQETDHVLGHELVHAFQYDISGLGRSRGSPSAAARTLGTTPLWFIEGMAEYLSVGPVDAHTAMWLRDAVLTGNVPTIEQLSTDPRVFPYRWGHAFWAYVGGRWGDAAIGQILTLVGQGIAYPQAIQRVLNIELEELGQDWTTAIRRAYLPLLAERPEAREIAEPLITQAREGGRLNLGPAISPDGRYVAFLSEIDFFDVELWLADATTGEVIRRLQKGTAFDPHFQSLRYISSAGSWSPDSRRFVFSALRNGQDVLVFLNVETGEREQIARIPGVIEISTPNWSPDGRTVVFSGVEGGVSDLYAYDVETRETRRLTEDLYANLHPSVSPDGRTIAFVTDQGPDTDLSTLRYGAYRIALLDVATGQVRQVAGAEGSSINPVWTRDGEGLYFVSNRSGIPNVYRLNLADGRTYRLTELFGGVSGITDISPAITAARDTDRLLFTAYEDNGYNIYSITEPEKLAGSLAEEPPLPGPESPAALPPLPRPEQAPFNRVTAYLADPLTGLPGTEVAVQWEVTDYDPDLHLDFLGQPQVGYSTGGVQGQGGLYGGIAAAFSDVLGYHNLFTTVQAQGELDQFGFSVLYLNRKHRWNWGGYAQRVPYISLGRRLLAGDIGGQPVIRDQIVRYRTFNTNLQGVAQYPFSPSQRVELSSGYRRIAQDIQIDEYLREPGSGRIFERLDRVAPDSLSNAWNLFESSVALVYDNALNGYTSPFAGQRYRFEATPVLGSLNYLQALADYRRYQWLRPFTLAFQGLHFGRYGTAESSQSFYPIFLAQPSLVRGYYGLYNECRGSSGQCDTEALTQLFGSRIAVAKAELRFPLIRQLVLGPIPFPPIEGYLFGDAGVAWDRETSVAFERFSDALGEDQRGFLTSAGIGARVNLLGYVIAEINYVNAFQWDGRGWHWQFALQPGF